ncbi:hypothetical protein, conserved [Babesia bigemina]|uniref:Uncharacterized protein n=1 Tax=Babesia bigemina TaxID=5866 RepID=A0A061D5G5_BABBI|nr:hypothetical protein, conserved [Babesia bigemina]CDR95961.1 hypothetical protein, conserved [Babesia bigemina]|eukprot:XP_012768147.1 hypothetical protein, conserved [Babesia bigemina]
MPLKTSKIATRLVIAICAVAACCYKPCVGLYVPHSAPKDGILSAVNAWAAPGFLAAAAYGSPPRHAKHRNARLRLTSSRNVHWLPVNDGGGGESYPLVGSGTRNGRNDAQYRNFALYAKPVISDHSYPRSRIPRHATVDYENLLRSHDPEQINYNTRLRDMPGVDMGALDNVYGRIFDRRVLIKQLRYFLERDEFHSIKRLLSENRLVLTKEDCKRFVDDVDHLLQVRLGYQEPTDENMEQTMPFLVARYVLQHLIPQDRQTLSCYRWLEPKEAPADVPEYTEDYEEPKGTPEKPARVEDTVAYRKIMKRLRTVQPELRLKVMKELFLRLYRAKRNKLFECLWKYQRLKPNAEVWRKRKVRNKVNIDRVSPFLSRPTRCTEEMVKEYTGHFEEAVNKGDLATACRLLKRYVRRIDWKNNMRLMLKFKDLFGEMHRCRKYSLEALRKLRILYWSTVKFRKVLIKINEPAMVHEAGKTMKELYEEQLQNWRERTRAKNDELMRRRGIDMDKVRDFSNIYGFDWVPILYPEEYEAGIKAQEERLNKLRRKAQWVKDELQRRRIREMGEGDEPVRKKGKTPTLWI